MKIRISAVVGSLILACLAGNTYANSFHQVGDMGEVRARHSMNTLNEGRVLVAGGSQVNNLSQTETVELFDPNTETFQFTESMSVRRYGHASLELDDGKILIAGGWVSSYVTATSSAEQYDPDLETFTTIGSMSIARGDFPPIVKTNGRIFIFGGTYEGSYGTATDRIDEYHPDTQSFTHIGNLVLSRRDHAAQALDNGKVLIIGGLRRCCNDSGDEARRISAEIYDPETNISRLLETNLNIGRARLPYTVLLADGRVLIAGGGGGDQAAEIFDPTDETFTLLDDSIQFFDNPIMQTLPSGNVFMYPAEVPNTSERFAAIFTPGDGSFEILEVPIEMGDIAAASPLNDGRLLLTGGYYDGESKKHAFIFDEGEEPDTLNPVVLIHGYCGSAGAGDEKTFGELGPLLESNSGRTVHYFDYSGPDSSYSDYERRDLVTLAGKLGEFIVAIGEPVDVVAHSMGGLVTRAWMAGLSNVPYEESKINKLVLAGTPNFGSGLDELGDLLTVVCPEVLPVGQHQVDQMAYDSFFIKRLNEAWQAKVNVTNIIDRTIHPEDILLLRGCIYAEANTKNGNGGCNTDSIVRASSAALPVPNIGDYAIRNILALHSENLVDPGETTDHSYQYIDWFLGGANPEDDPANHLPPMAPPTNSLVVVPMVEGHDATSTPFGEARISHLKQISPYVLINKNVSPEEGAAEESGERTGWHTFYPSVGAEGEFRGYEVDMEKSRKFDRTYELDYPLVDALFLTLQPGRPLISEPIIVDAKVDLPDVIAKDVYFCNASSHEGCSDFDSDTSIFASPNDLLDVEHLIANIAVGSVDKKVCTRFFLSADESRGADIELNRAELNSNFSDGYEIVPGSKDCVRKNEWSGADSLVRSADLIFDIELDDFEPPVIPGGAPAGTYHLLVCADDNNDSSEYIGSNNCVVADRHIQVE